MMIGNKIFEIFDAAFYGGDWVLLFILLSAYCGMTCILINLVKKGIFK